MIYLGTSGYSFRDWIGPFYPPGITSGKMLEYYAEHFSCVEINSTYYRLPNPAVMAQIERKTPGNFLFTVKLQQEVTHRQTRDLEQFDAFRKVVEPLGAAGKFRGALAQFPWGFRESPTNREYLRILRAGLPDLPLFVEFRHDSWARGETFDLLAEIGVGFCSVDEPRLQGLFPPLARAVGEIGYVRLHGRNSQDWWGGDSSGRYNYLYSDDELKEWVGKIRELASTTRDTFVFFNNCHAGRAVQNAKRMAELLELDF